MSRAACGGVAIFTRHIAVWKNFTQPPALPVVEHTPHNRCTHPRIGYAMVAATCIAPDDNRVVDPVPPTNRRAITAVRYDALFRHDAENQAVVTQPLFGPPLGTVQRPQQRCQVPFIGVIGRQVRFSSIRQLGECARKSKKGT